MATSSRTDGANRVEEALVTWVYPQRRRLTALVEAGTFTAEAREEMLRELMEAAVKTLDIERASIWRMRQDASAIECLLMFTQACEPLQMQGMVLERETAPSYFRALEAEHIIAAHDARTDPRTSEFRESYLEPFDIGSMLDAPVFVRGKATAVVCYERMGPPRRWEHWEELVGSTFADFVALVFEAESQQSAIAETLAQSVELHRIVDAHTAALAQSERDLRALLGSAPIALLLVRAGDRSISYANERASALLETTGEISTDFWVHADDREQFTCTLLSAGHVEQLEAELRTAKGKLFWARISATTMRFQGELTFVMGLLDITERRRAAEALRRSESLLRTLLDAAPSPLLVTGVRDDIVRYANAPACALFEVPADELIGHRVPDSFCDLADRRMVMKRLHEEHHIESMTLHLSSARGRSFWGLMNVRTAVLDGEEVHIAGVVDLTVQKELEERLRDLATTDELTGVHNRRHFFDLGSRELARSERHGLMTTVAMIDIDHFKRINDRHGHATGDDVLREFAATLSEHVRSTDIVARLGGEEFALLFPETPLAGAAVTVERIRRAVAERSFRATSDRVTLSAGLVEHHRGESLSDVLSRADEHLYRAKNAGRNQLSMPTRTSEPGRDRAPEHPER